jgi:hypothetical protein
MRSKSALVAVVLLVSAFVSSVANAAALRVVIVQTDDLASYTKALGEGQKLLSGLKSSGKLRAWLARYAGPESGAVAVAIEYPDLETLAADEVKSSKDPAFQAWMKSLSAKRKILSDSIYVELDLN